MNFFTVDSGLAGEHTLQIAASHLLQLFLGKKASVSNVCLKVNRRQSPPASCSAAIHSDLCRVFDRPQGFHWGQYKSIWIIRTCYHAPQPSNALGRSQMAKPNYSFEKRQKELAKKKKQEEKRLKKMAPQTGQVPAETILPNVGEKTDS
jgi:hypothetical protein